MNQKDKEFLKKFAIASSTVLMINGCSSKIYVGAVYGPQPLSCSIKSTPKYYDISKYTNSLKLLGKFANEREDDNLTLTILPIENKSAIISKLPSDITIMVKNALNSIESQKIIAIPIEDLTLKSDYFLIKGAITKLDKLESKDINLKLLRDKNSKSADYISDIDQYSISSITIDFNIVNAKTKKFIPIPGVHTRNSVKITNLIDSANIKFSITGTGLSVNGSVNKKQGIHSIIKLLVELSIVELIGKLKNYPYWIFIHNGKIDNDLLEKMRSDFINFDLNKRLFYIQHLLSIIYPDVKVGDKNMKNTNQRIIEFKKDNIIIPYNSEINTELYTKLLIEIPKVLAQKGWSKDIKQVFGKVLNY